jgi:drug/metabolite transporter (DMT)-like permease
LLLAAAAITAAPLFGWEILHDERVTLNWKALVAIAYIGIPGGAVMYLLYNMGVQALGATKSGATFYLQTVFTALLGYLLLGERLHAYHLVGIALIAVGVLLVMRGKPEAPKRTAVAG